MSDTQDTRSSMSMVTHRARSSKLCKTTTASAAAGNLAGYRYRFDEAMVPWVHWGEYFDKYGLKEPKTGNHIPHSFAWGHPELNFWQAISKSPQRLLDFNQSMNTLDEVLPVTGMYDFGWIAKADISEDRPLIVDVGGGKGQALKRIMAAYPEMPPKKLVLQDREAVIEEVTRANEAGFEEVKKMPHDFFQPNPVKGDACLPGLFCSSAFTRIANSDRGARLLHPTLYARLA